MRDSYEWLNEYRKKGWNETKEEAKKGNIYAAALITDDPKDSMWFPMPVLSSLGLNSTFDLCSLIHFQFVERPNAEKENDGWFECSVEDVKEWWEPSNIGSPERQTRMLRRLEDTGFIKRKVVGKPVRRWLWIDFDRVIREHAEDIMEQADADKKTKKRRRLKKKG